MAFVFIKTALDRDANVWEAKREKRREAGSMGGRQRVANQANATFAKQEQANQAVLAPVPVLAPVLAPVPVRENKADKPPRASRFTPPSVEEVRVYCQERQNGVDAQRFVDFYTANGWSQGRGKPIKDWKAAVRTWEGREDKPAQRDISSPDSYTYTREESL